MKKYFCLIVAFTMLLGMSTAFAADNARSGNDAFGSGAGANNPLYEKSVLFLGDSICAADCEKNDPVYRKTVGWAGRIGVKNRMSWINGAASGASFSTCRSGNRIIDQVERVKGNTFDLVILQGGVNDAWDNAAIGTVDENLSGKNFNQDTFSGGFEATVNKVREYFPNASVGFIVNYRTPKAHEAWGITGLKDENTVKYFNRAREICEKWGVPYLDLYSDQDFNDHQLKVETKEFLSDYVHPNSMGYNILAPVIEQWMEIIANPSQFKTMYGASVRYDEPTGLRFTLAMTASKKEQLFNNPSKTLGMLIFPADQLSGAENEPAFDFMGPDKKLTIEFTNDDFYTDAENDKKSGFVGGWYVSGVLANIYIQNYQRDFIAVGYIADTSQPETTYEYASFIGSHNVRSLAQAASKAYTANSSDSALIAEMIEKAVYSAYGVVEIRTANGASYLSDGQTYASYYHLRQAMPVSIHVTNETVVTEEGQRPQIDAFFRVGKVRVDTVNGIEFNYVSDNESVATASDGTIYALSEGSATIGISAGTFSANLAVTVKKGPPVVGAMRDDYSDCFAIVHDEGVGASVRWPMDGKVKQQWAKTEALVTNYDSEYRYLKLTFTSERAHKVGIYYASGKWQNDEKSLRVHTDIESGTTVWYVEMPSGMAEDFELRYFIDAHKFNDTGSIIIKTEFVKVKP